MHVDFNCLFNKGESFEWPERVPFRLTHNMEAAMGPLKHEGMYRSVTNSTEYRKDKNFLIGYFCDIDGFRCSLVLRVIVFYYIVLFL